MRVQKKNVDIISKLKLPKTYMACQIRGGDKYLEDALLSVSLYTDRLKLLDNCNAVFVLTDDYRLIEELQESKLKINWYTLCEKIERGYFHDSFTKKVLR